jgi:hypothetical protein
MDYVSNQKAENTFSPLALNFDDYKEEMAEFELTQEQEQELLQTLWNIMYQFAQMGFGMESTQLIMEALLKTVDQDSGKPLQVKD